jgi:hypothetical protein
MNNIISKIKLSYLIIIILVIIILLQRACNPEYKITSGTTSVKIDTVYKHIHDTVYKNVKVIKRVYVPVNKPEYTPGESLDTCKLRFNNLLREHLTQSIYLDTINIDDIGSVVVIDTVWMNKLYGKRKYITDYKIPTITVTITKKEDPKRQLYIGGNLFGNQASFQSVTPGLLYKDKKDRMYQANVGLNVNGHVTYGIGTYWKIKIK